MLARLGPNVGFPGFAEQPGRIWSVATGHPWGVPRPHVCKPGPMGRLPHERPESGDDVMAVAARTVGRRDDAWSRPRRGVVGKALRARHRGIGRAPAGSADGRQRRRLPRRSRSSASRPSSAWPSHSGACRWCGGRAQNGSVKDAAVCLVDRAPEVLCGLEAEQLVEDLPGRTAGVGLGLGRSMIEREFGE